MLFVNFKAYEEATGDNAVEIAKACEKVYEDTKKEIILCVQAVDIYRVSKAVDLKVYAQHADPVEYGSKTGHVLIDSLKQAGAVGTILNHSENRIDIEKIKQTVELCKKKKFKVIVCCKDPEEVEKMTRLEPNFVAYEPPELIGGDISVSSSKPEVITQSVNKAMQRKVPLIVGAGIKTTEDVMISKDLGAVGVLVASGVIKAQDKIKAVKELIEGL